MFQRQPTKSVHQVAHSYAGTNVTTAAWVEIEDSMPDACTELDIFDGSGKILYLGVGAAGAEVIKAIIPPGGPLNRIPCNIPKGARVALKAVDATASTGYAVINFLG
jgi:hypothetical protein